MRKPFWVVPALCLALLVGASNGVAQGKRPPWLHRPQGQSAGSTVRAPGAAPSSLSYAFTFVNFPGELVTCCLALNPGATASLQMLTGGYAALPLSAINNGFFVDLSSTDGVVTQTFSTINYPGSTNSSPNDINDAGQIVGAYADSAGNFHGYELSGGKFTAINVPFSGALGTSADAINNTGNMAGTWYSSTATSGFELIGGTYTSLQVPGASNTVPTDIDSNNDVVGYYWIGSNFDTTYGFKLTGGVYTTIQVPGSTTTYIAAINDSGEIAGYYCTTTACADELATGVKGFLLNGGVYSTVTVPLASDTFLNDISDAGVISGGYFEGNGLTSLQHGFIGVPK